jgi:hypothetical protein
VERLIGDAARVEVKTSVIGSPSTSMPAPSRITTPLIRPWRSFTASSDAIQPPTDDPTTRTSVRSSCSR